MDSGAVANLALYVIAAANHPVFLLSRPFA
jgi:hypothetical protein